MTPRPLRRPLAVLIAGLMVGVSACDGDDGDHGDHGDGSVTTEPAAVDIDATAYVTVISRFLPPSLDPESPRVVYVVPVSGDALPLDTQVAVIEALAVGHDIRFVDQVDAALDVQSSEEPPRNEGTLIGLGRITPESPHQVRVELYRGRDRVSGHLLTLRNEGDAWVVVTAETVTPEVLVGDG